MDKIQWIFSGIGTYVIELTLTAIIGFCGYKIISRKKYVQKQKAGKNSKQTQQFIDNTTSENEINKKSVTTLVQKQKAGDDSEQSQIGR